MSLFSLLAYDPLVTDIGESTFVFDNGVIHVDMLDTGRAHLTLRVLERGTLQIQTSALLHSKGFLKTELKKDQRQHWVNFLGKSFNDLDKSLHNGNVIAQLNAWSHTQQKYQQWLREEPLPQVTSIALDATRSHRWYLYQNFKKSQPVLTIVPNEGACFAHPCDRLWTHMAERLNTQWKKKSSTTSDDIMKDIREMYCQLRDGAQDDRGKTCLNRVAVAV